MDINAQWLKLVSEWGEEILKRGYSYSWACNFLNDSEAWARNNQPCALRLTWKQEWKSACEIWFKQVDELYRQEPQSNRPRTRAWVDRHLDKWFEAFTEAFKEAWVRRLDRLVASSPPWEWAQENLGVKIHLKEHSGFYSRNESYLESYLDAPRVFVEAIHSSVNKVQKEAVGSRQEALNWLCEHLNKRVTQKITQLMGYTSRATTDYQRLTVLHRRYLFQERVQENSPDALSPWLKEWINQEACPSKSGAWLLDWSNRPLWAMNLESIASGHWAGTCYWADVQAILKISPIHRDLDEVGVFFNAPKADWSIVEFKKTWKTLKEKYPGHPLWEPQALGLWMMAVLQDPHVSLSRRKAQLRVLWEHAHRLQAPWPCVFKMREGLNSSPKEIKILLSTQELEELNQSIQAYALEKTVMNPFKDPNHAPAPTSKKARL